MTLIIIAYGSYPFRIPVYYNIKNKIFFKIRKFNNIAYYSRQGRQLGCIFIAGQWREQLRSLWSLSASHIRRRTHIGHLHRWTYNWPERVKAGVSVDNKVPSGGSSCQTSIGTLRGRYGHGHREVTGSQKVWTAVEITMLQKVIDIIIDNNYSDIK